MLTALYQIESNTWQASEKSQDIDVDQVDLVLCFSSKKILQSGGQYEMIRSKFPNAEIVLSSTAGEIYDTSVMDDTITVTAIQLEKSSIIAKSVNIQEFSNTYSATMTLANQFPHEELRYLMVISDGNLVNGSELVKGFAAQLPEEVLVTGGLAGDGPDFHSTLVGLNNDAVEGEIVAIAMYGDHLTVTHGSQGGWDIFGLEKRVTNASGNVLVELENQNALDLYKKYLGHEAKNLPGSALLFPLSVVLPGAKKPVVRTILSINEDEKSMTFAGNVPVGSKVRFMKANFDQLTVAASEAAKRTSLPTRPPDFSLLISCVGRKLVLADRIGDEVISVRNSLGQQTLISGFYSYGEISPFNDGGDCQLHNQTMTITSFYED